MVGEAALAGQLEVCLESPVHDVCNLLNLTLAAQRVNRHEKGGRDVAGWMPGVSACWFVARTLEVRRKYGLTIDRAEAAAAEKVLAGCDETAMPVVACAPATRPRRRGAPVDLCLRR